MPHPLSLHVRQENFATMGDTLTGDADAASRACDETSQWPGYAPTPLLRLSGLARRLDVGEIWCKDESSRFGLGSFKALGGAYAVFRHLARTLELRGMSRVSTLRELQAPQFRAALTAITVACATAGNHGRAVAWGAQLCGCKCVTFLPSSAGTARAAALEAIGARVIRVDGTYDDALRIAATDAAENGWDIISDTSAGGHAVGAADVQAGYGVLFRELVDALPSDARPTHLFVQAGVGSLAAAACSFVARTSDWRSVATVVVEPATAACLLASAEAGGLVNLETPIDTFMGGLACATPSPLAWDTIEPIARAYLAIPDEATRDAMRMLAHGVGGDSPVFAGPSGAAGAAGLIAACGQPAVRDELGLTQTSSVIVIATEGLT